MARLHRADLNGFLAPAHYLVGADVGWQRQELRTSEWATAQPDSWPSSGTHSLGVGTSLTDRGGHLSPLQHHILNDPPVRVDIHALVLVAQQHLHAIGVGEEDDGVGGDLTLDLGMRRWAGDPASGTQTGSPSPPTAPPRLHAQGCRCHSCSPSRHPQRGNQRWSHR